MSKSGRSLISRIVEFYIEHSSHSTKNIVANNKVWQEYLAESAKENELEYKIPVKLSSPVVSRTDTVQTYTMPVYTLNPQSSALPHVLYIHGGSCIKHISSYHWKMLDTIAQSTKVEITVPIYPVAPIHTYIEATALIEDLYRRMVSQYGADNIIMMGDSAGGGIAACMCQYFAKLGLNQPLKLILLSPCVDATLENPDIKEYEEVDPMLTPKLFNAGIPWVGEDYSNLLDKAPENSRLRTAEHSAIFGDLSVLRNVTSFVGTHEIFYPDVAKFHQKLLEAGVNSRLIVGEGMNHVWPCYPIPEARDAIKTICTLILEPVSNSTTGESSSSTSAETAQSDCQTSPETTEEERAPKETDIPENVPKEEHQESGETIQEQKDEQPQTTSEIQQETPTEDAAKPPKAQDQ